MKSVVTLLLLALLFSACADGQAGPWVAAVERANADADKAIAKRNLPVAIQALTQAVGLDPSGVASADLRAVRADLFFRIAELELARGYPATARTRADQGLALGTPDDVYTANLYIVRGRANEALNVKRAAIDDYHRALVINEALLDDLMEDP